MEPGGTTVPEKPLPERIREYFGFHKFRPGQAEAVHSALQGHDILVAMPTGSVKLAPQRRHTATHPAPPSQPNPR
jgi:hypothetical protein